LEKKYRQNLQRNKIVENVKKAEKEEFITIILEKKKAISSSVASRAQWQGCCQS